MTAKISFWPPKERFLTKTVKNLLLSKDCHFSMLFFMFYSTSESPGLIGLTQSYSKIVSILRSQSNQAGLAQKSCEVWTHKLVQLQIHWEFFKLIAQVTSFIPCKDFDAPPGIARVTNWIESIWRSNSRGNTKLISAQKTYCCRTQSTV